MTFFFFSFMSRWTYNNNGSYPIPLSPSTPTLLLFSTSTPVCSSLFSVQHKVLNKLYPSCILSSPCVPFALSLFPSSILPPTPFAFCGFFICIFCSLSSVTVQVKRNCTVVANGCLFYYMLMCIPPFGSLCAPLCGLPRAVLLNTGNWFILNFNLFAGFQWAIVVFFGCLFFFVHVAVFVPLLAPKGPSPHHHANHQQPTLISQCPPPLSPFSVLQTRNAKLTTFRHIDTYFYMKQGGCQGSEPIS
ncbi:hypothetical protein F5H01DRAFT_203148 [Linnemannia elongata]|nr:hypothetical protein F5H01DRAFT_203148 [Linnemannia elongata]